MAQGIVRETPTHVVNTTLNYYLEPSQGGSTSFYPGTAGNYRRKFNEQAVQVTDLRGSENNFRLDKQGFQVRRHICTEKDFADEDVVKDVVYKEISELLKKVTGATRVHPFSHIIRRQTWEAALNAGKGLPDGEGVKMVVPARFVHIDQSYDGALEVLSDNLPLDLATDLSKTHWGIMNVWRPIHSPVLKDPLAMCDARSVPESDLAVMRALLPSKGSSTYESVSAGGGFETWTVKANPDHRWYFASGLAPEEVLLIKIFDSKKDGRARRVPHSAFVNPSTEHGEYPPRESIEVRCLVFWENEDAE